MKSSRIPTGILLESRSPVGICGGVISTGMHGRLAIYYSPGWCDMYVCGDVGVGGVWNLKDERLAYEDVGEEGGHKTEG